MAKLSILSATYTPPRRSPHTRCTWAGLLWTTAALHSAQNSQPRHAGERARWSKSWIYL